jgi:DNA gyrase inhibitor GyrI
VAKQDSNSIIKFADDTTVVGLITDNDKTAYREEFRELAVWCQDNNLSLNVSKTVELIVDYRKR